MLIYVASNDNSLSNVQISKEQAYSCSSIQLPRDITPCLFGFLIQFGEQTFTDTPGAVHNYVSRIMDQLVLFSSTSLGDP